MTPRFGGLSQSNPADRAPPRPDRGETLGLLITYVDDFLLLMQNGMVKDGLVHALREIWTMSSQVDLVPNQPFTFLGLEMEKRENGGIYMHQRGFVQKLLASHGLDQCSKGNQNVVMPNPTELDGPPSAELLKNFKALAVNSIGSLHGRGPTWLTTRQCWPQRPPNMGPGQSN